MYPELQIIGSMLHFNEPLIFQMWTLLSFSGGKLTFSCLILHFPVSLPHWQSTTVSLETKLCTHNFSNRSNCSKVPSSTDTIWFPFRSLKRRAKVKNKGLIFCYFLETPICKTNHATAKWVIMEPLHPGGENNKKDRQKANQRLINKCNLW